MNLKLITIYKTVFIASLLSLMAIIFYSYFFEPITNLVKDYIIPFTVIVFSFGQLLNSEKNSLFEIMKHNREVKSKFINSLATLENESSWSDFTHSQAVDFKNKANCIYREAMVYFRNTPEVVRKTKELKELCWRHVEAIQVTGNNNIKVNRNDNFSTLFNEIYDLLMIDKETAEWIRK